MSNPIHLHQINYNHLLYFWVVARTGSVTKASEELRVAQPTVSTQLRLLEESLGVQLFDRSARGMTLTAAGQVVMRHADEMFRLGNDLVRALSTGEANQLQPLQVGASDSVPKVIVRGLLMPVLEKGMTSAIVCREWRVDHLFNELHMHRLDIVFSDQIMSPLIRRQTMSYEVGSSPITICATKDLAQRLRKGFPRSLDGAPMIAPADNSALREKLDAWLAANTIRPKYVVETEDRSLAHYFATEGVGAVCVAMTKSEEVCRQFDLEKIGIIKGVTETYYAIAVERSHQHPAVTHICSMAKQRMVVE